MRLWTFWGKLWKNINVRCTNWYEIKRVFVNVTHYTGINFSNTCQPLLLLHIFDPIFSEKISLLQFR